MKREADDEPRCFMATMNQIIARVKILMQQFFDSTKNINAMSDFICNIIKSRGIVVSEIFFITSKRLGNNCTSYLVFGISEFRAYRIVYFYLGF